LFEGDSGGGDDGNVNENYKQSPVERKTRRGGREEAEMKTVKRKTNEKIFSAEKEFNLRFNEVIEVS